MKPNKMVKNSVIRNENGQVVSGVLNPKGRPKGKSMKEFVRQYLEQLTDEDKLEWVKSIPKDIQWRMSEGNPSNETDVTSGGQPIPFMTLDELRKDNSNNKDSESQEED